MDSNTDFPKFYKGKIDDDWSLRVDSNFGTHMMYAMNIEKKRIWILSPYVHSNQVLDLVQMAYHKKTDCDVRLITLDTNAWIIKKALRSCEASYLDLVRHDEKECNEDYSCTEYSFWHPNVDFYFLKTNVVDKGEDILKNIHAKIYLIGDTVYSGSMNFTDNGLYSNIEVMTKCTQHSGKYTCASYLETLMESDIITRNPICKKFENNKSIIAKKIDTLSLENWEKVQERISELLDELE